MNRTLPVRIKVINYIPRNAIPTPEIFIDLQKRITSTKELYAIGFQYFNGDVQFGLSGSCIKGEEFVSALRREVFEETGLITDIKQHNILEYVSHSRKNKLDRIKWNAGIIPIECLDTASQSINLIEKHTSRSKDNKKRKIAAIVYGQKELLIEKLNNAIKTNPNVGKSDGITHFVVFPLSLFQQIKRTVKPLKEIPPVVHY